MKRKLQLLGLTFVMAAALLPSSGSAQVPDEFIVRSSATNVKVGDYVTISIAGRALTDLYAADMELTYDAQTLEYIGYTSSLNNQAYVLEPKVQGNTIKLLFSLLGNKPGITGDRDLFALSFKASKAGTASVSLSSLTPVNSEPQKTTGTIGDGVVMSIHDTNTDSHSGSHSGHHSASSSSPSSSGTSVLVFDTFTVRDGVAFIPVGSQDLLEAGKSSMDKSVTIKINSATDVKEIQLQLPAKPFQQLYSASYDVRTVKVETGLATAFIHLDILDKSLLSDTSNLQINMAKVDPANLSQDIREKIGTSILYDFHFSLDGSPIVNFKKNSILVELPYTLAPHEQPSQVVIYSITEDGKLEIVRNGRYNRATGKVQFQPVHLGTYMAHHVQVSFRDMDGYTWANEAVLGLAAREVVKGRSDGRFIPDGEVTRAEFVKMLIQLLDLGDSSATASFTDVEPGAWYYNAIASAQKAGLIQGKDDGSFGVNEPVSREDMATLIYRALKIINSTTAQTGSNTSDFLDQDRISAYAKEAVWTVKQAGLLDGVGEGYFEPKGKTTRAQAATVIYRLYQAVE